MCACKAVLCAAFKLLKSLLKSFALKTKLSINFGAGSVAF